MPRAIEGLKVIDLSRGMAGAVSGMMLSDHGAAVIRVEPPGGDPTRQYQGNVVWDRGKQSITLDLEQEQGRQVLLKLLEDADVLLETGQPGDMDRLGLGYGQIKERFPRLVYCSVSPYGQQGPQRDRPAYGALVEARMGQTAEQKGYRDGPIYLGWQLANWGAVFLTIIGILTAVYARTNTGRGQHVDTSLYDGVVGQATLRWKSGEGLPPSPQTQSNVPRRVTRQVVGLYECGDGEWLYVHTLARGAFSRFMRVVGMGDLARDYNDPQEHAEQMPPEQAQRLTQDLPVILKTKPREEWLQMIEEAEVPVLAANPPGQSFDDEHTKAIGMVVDVKDPEFGMTKQVGIAQKFFRTPGEVTGPSPKSGQHTDDILSKSGYSDEQIQELRSKGVI